MYLKYQVLILSCMISGMHASSSKKFSGSKSMGALPSAISILSAELECDSKTQERMSPSRSTTDAAASSNSIPIEHASQPSSLGLYYDYPGESSPVYAYTLGCMKGSSHVPTSPIHGWFPCGT